MREYERKRQFDEFKDRVGEIINGTVKRTEYGNLMSSISAVPRRCCAAMS